MVYSTLCKLLQKQTYDVLSHRHGTLFVIGCIVLILISAFQFGEVALEWSHEKYAALSNSMIDNIAGKSFRSRMCLPLPIDVVYTWVNGSDPKLLSQLQKVKLAMEHDLNDTSQDNSKNYSAACTFSNCIQVNIAVIEPQFPPDVTLAHLSDLYPAFSKATKFMPMKSHDGLWNVSVAYFDSEEDITSVLKETVVFSTKNFTIKQAFLTSDWTIPKSLLLHDTVIMTGFPHKYSNTELKSKLPFKHKTATSQIDLYKENSIAVVHIPDKEEAESFLQDGNFTIDGKVPTLNAANLIWDMKASDKYNEDVATHRFEDNEELRYSLRSIEKHAPWVRHIYLVTNGQLPSWLNLEHPRLTVITHEEIFPNTSYLPTFSSPAIEANIHRIPGLSDKFIYMNDDVLFGKDVWPDDFYTHANGQKVYLTWPVPHCHEGCPNTWIKDGYCDKSCNNSECEWDGGDCESGKPGQGHLVGGAPAGIVGGTSDLFCNSGCANNWIADRYCDQACNVKSCGFDAGDCGVDQMKELHRIDLQKKTNSYSLPNGLTIAYFNLSDVFEVDTSIKEAHYDEQKIVRSATISNKFKILTLILFPKYNDTVLTFYLAGEDKNETKIKFTFNVTVNTQPVKNLEELVNVTHEGKILEKSSNITNNTKIVTEIPWKPYLFEDIPLELQSPKIHSLIAKSPDADLKPLDPAWEMYELPVNTSKQLDMLHKRLQSGELTDRGFKHRAGIIWTWYLHELKKSGKTLVKKSIVSETVKEKHEGDKNVKTPSDIQLQNQNLNKSSNMFHVIDSQVRGLNQSKPGRKLQSISIDLDSDGGLFPWEKKNSVFEKIRKKRELLLMQYAVERYKGRKLLDTFGDSLRHVNRLFNKEFGFSSRKVPAHMPHFVDKNIMNELQERFPAAWDTTSRHKVRSSDDMQFAFSYFYFMMSEPKNSSVEDFVDEIDADHSRVLSDREIRVLATKLYELPLDLQTLTKLEQTIKNCSASLSDDQKSISPEPEQESYYEKDMPQVTRNLVLHCEPLVKQIKDHVKSKTKYKFEIAGEDDIAFKMIEANVSRTIGQLDDIRKNRKKFICLNDNMKHGSEEAATVKAILQDFYESLFPLQSQFELPREYRNRFLHVEELRDWQYYRDWLRFTTHITLAFLILFAIVSFFQEKIDALKRRYSRRRVVASPPNEKVSSSPSSPPSSQPLVQSV